jgi:hypothetical protein
MKGLSKAYKMARSKEMSQELKAALNRRQRALVTPALFECTMTGDAQRLFCLLEDGDNVNPTVSLSLSLCISLNEAFAECSGRLAAELGCGERTP